MSERPRRGAPALVTDASVVFLSLRLNNSTLVTGVSADAPARENHERARESPTPRRPLARFPSVMQKAQRGAASAGHG